MQESLFRDLASTFYYLLLFFYEMIRVIRLSNLASWLNLAKERSNIQSAIEVDCRENHTLTLDAHHLARSKVGYEQYVLANQLLWLVVGCDT